MKSIVCSLTLLATTVIVSSSAYAQGGPREACREDAHSFCGDIQPGGGRIIECLKDHYQELSDSCYSALQEMKQRRQSQGGNPPPPPPPGNGGNDRPPPPPEGDNGNPPPPSDNGDQPPPPPEGDNGNPPPPPEGNSGMMRGSPD